MDHLIEHPCSVSCSVYFACGGPQKKIRGGSGKPNDSKGVRFANFQARSPELVPEPTFACTYYDKPFIGGCFAPPSCGKKFACFFVVYDLLKAD